MEKTICYSNNGDSFHGENMSFEEAKTYLKQKGYTTAFSGRKFTSYGQKVIIGINKDNAINIENRRKNGLFNARQIIL